MNNTRKPRILITNDDGVKNANLHDLASALSPLGEVFVFAPETEQSGVSQAFTVRSPLRVKKISVSALFGAGCIVDDTVGLPYEVYSVSGTPADSAKFALGYFAGKFFANGECCGDVEKCAALDIHGNPTFDVCFSGVNVGENSGVSSLYSGTVAGAREAALWGVPAVALSVSLGGETLMPEVLSFAKRIVSERTFISIPKGSFWNVNFPKAVGGAFKGYRATTMALGMFTDHYDSTDAFGVDGTWQLDGEKLWDKEPVDTDDYLLHQGYATITPHRIDQTDVESLKKINKMLAGGACIES